MTTSVDAAKSLVSELEARVQAGDVHEAKETLAKLKIALLSLDPNSSDEHLLIATSALELAVLLSVEDGDFDAFARHMAQLKPYYYSFPTTAAMASTTGSSKRKCHVLGLNLMHLLVDNRLSEFHSQLELLSNSESTNPLVSFPIQLERQLMVGSYDEVLNAGLHVPDASYRCFMDNLLLTVRDSIADCIEVTYHTLSLADAVTMMKFDTQQALTEYLEECRDDWIVEGDRLCFQPPPSGNKASDIPNTKLIAQSLSYATEMERIV